MGPFPSLIHAAADPLLGKAKTGSAEAAEIWWLIGPLNLDEVSSSPQRKYRYLSKLPNMPRQSDGRPTVFVIERPFPRSPSRAGVQVCFVHRHRAAP